MLVEWLRPSRQIACWAAKSLASPYRTVMRRGSAQPLGYCGALNKRTATMVVREGAGVDCSGGTTALSTTDTPFNREGANSPALLHHPPDDRRACLPADEQAATTKASFVAALDETYSSADDQLNLSIKELRRGNDLQLETPIQRLSINGRRDERRSWGMTSVLTQLTVSPVFMASHLTFRLCKFNGVKLRVILNKQTNH